MNVQYIINWICKLKPCDSRNAIIKPNLKDAKEELPVQDHVNMSNRNVLRKWPVLPILTCARAITLINLRMGNSLILRNVQQTYLALSQWPFCKIEQFPTWSRP